MSFLRSLPFIPWQTPEFSAEDQARLDDYNKQIDAYSKAVDDYNAYIEKWNAGPRTSDPTMQPPKELPFTQAELDTFSEAAANTAQKTAAQRELALAVAANPQQYGLSGFGFADGGEVSPRTAFIKQWYDEKYGDRPIRYIINDRGYMADPRYKALTASAQSSNAPATSTALPPEIAASEPVSSSYTVTPQNIDIGTTTFTPSPYTPELLEEYLQQYGMGYADGGEASVQEFIAAQEPRGMTEEQAKSELRRFMDVMAPKVMENMPVMGLAVAPKIVQKMGEEAVKRYEKVSDALKELSKREEKARMTVKDFYADKATRDAAKAELAEIQAQQPALRQELLEAMGVPPVKRAEGSSPSGELSPEDRQTQLDIMRDMMLAEKVAAYLGPNNERGEFNPEEFYPHMLGRGNDYNVKVSPGGIASPSWNKQGSIPYTSLETGERTEYPIRPGTINTYGKDSYDPYVISHEIDHDERHKWDVFAANLSEEQDRNEEIRVRRNDLLYAPDQDSWKRAVNNYYNFFNPGNEAEFADKEDAVMKSLMYTANKYPEDIPESRQAEDTYWRTRHKELNPSLLDSITEWLSDKTKKRADGSPEQGEMSTDEFVRQLMTEDQAVQDAERTRGEYLQQEGKEQKYENVYDALFRRNVDVKTNEDYRPDLLPIFRSAAVRAVMGERPTAGVDYEHYPALPSGVSSRGAVSDRKSRSKMTAADELSLVNDAIKSIGGGTLKVDDKGNLYLTDYYDFNMTDPSKIRDLYGAQRFGMGVLDKLGMLHNYRTELNLGNKYDLFRGLSKEEVDAALQRAKVQTFTPQGRKVVNPDPIGGTPDGA
jgi:hypothetical protein